MKAKGLLHAVADTVADVEPQTLYKTLINITAETQPDTLADEGGVDGKDTGHSLGNVEANLLLDAFTYTILEKETKTL